MLLLLEERGCSEFMGGTVSVRMCNGIFLLSFECMELIDSAVYSLSDVVVC